MVYEYLNHVLVVLNTVWSPIEGLSHKVPACAYTYLQVLAKNSQATKQNYSLNFFELKKGIFVQWSVFIQV